jgi:aminoglycoside phosphotransferase
VSPVAVATAVRGFRGGDRSACLARARAALGGLRPGWRVHTSMRGGSDVAVFRVGPLTGAEAVLKVATGPSGDADLAHEAAVLGTLAADPRLGGWAPAIPRVLEECVSDGHRILLETLLPGTDARAVLRERGRRVVFEASAREVARELHRRTEVSVMVDGVVLEEWVHRPAREIVGVVGARGQRSLDRLTAELDDALRGRPVRATRVHGDLCPDNLLVDVAGRVTGVVDWARTTSTGLPEVDLAHLELTSAAAAERRALGPMVRRVLDVSRADRVDDEGGDVGARHAVLLAWLHHAAGNLAASPRYRRQPLWRLRTVRPVVASRSRSGLHRDPPSRT